MQTIQIAGTLNPVTKSFLPKYEYTLPPLSIIFYIYLPHFLLFLSFFPKGASVVMSYHNNSVPQALIDLFPDIGVDEDKFPRNCILLYVLIYILLFFCFFLQQVFYELDLHIQKVRQMLRLQR